MELKTYPRPIKIFSERENPIIPVISEIFADRQENFSMCLILERIKGLKLYHDYISKP